MTPDWNAIRLDLLEIDEPMRASLREMRPFFAKSLPGILARFYDKVRHYDPACGIFRDGAMQEAIRMQLQHWDLIAAGDFGAAYTSSIARFCEFNQRAGVAPQWYVGCRLMFVADQLMKAVDAEVEVPRLGQRRAGRARQEGVDAKRHRQGQHAGYRKRRRVLFRLQPPGAQGCHRGGQRPLPRHHHLADRRPPANWKAPRAR